MAPCLPNLLCCIGSAFSFPLLADCLPVSTDYHVPTGCNAVHQVISKVSTYLHDNQAVLGIREAAWYSR